MNFHPSPEYRLHIGLNGAHEGARGNVQSRGRPFEDEALQFLSREEQECILYLEETINIFDDDLEDEDLFPRSSSPVESHQATADAATVLTLPGCLKEKDIIDLVQVQPDPPDPREVPHTPNMPDFRTIGFPPEVRTEVNVRRDQIDNQPVGSVPTPMVIAQKIAVHQGSGGPVTTSATSGHRRSLDFTGDYSSIPLPDHPVKQGPPTTAKPTRYPDNISVVLPSRDYNQTIAKASVNVHQRQAQVLANLTGRPQMYESKEEQQVRKVPNRSISFHDSTPSKSRMEALSKLGLTKERNLPAFSSNSNLANIITPSLSHTNSSSCSDNASDPNRKTETVASCSSAPKTHVSSTDHNTYSGKTEVTVPSKQKADAPSQRVNNSGKEMDTPASLQCRDGTFNNYGGKTNVISPVLSANSGLTSHHISKQHSKPTAAASFLAIAKTKANISNDINKYREITETPSNSFIQQDQKPKETTSSMSPKNTESFSNDFSYSGKTKPIIPSQTPSTKPAVNLTNSNLTSITFRPATSVPNVATRSMSFRAESRPQDAPRTGRQNRTASFSVGQWASTSSERRRSISKPPFWPQGITVQFSGRGPTDESRREALRKLGLLRDTF